MLELQLAGEGQKRSSGGRKVRFLPPDPASNDEMAGPQGQLVPGLPCGREEYKEQTHVGRIWVKMETSRKMTMQGEEEVE